MNLGSSVINLGSPLETSSAMLQSPHRKSLFRNWKRLSRFQKNLAYLATVIATLFLVYYTVVNSDKINEARPVAVITEDDLDSNVIGLLPPNSKNKVKEVQNALNGIKDRDLDVVPVEENNAQEEFGYGDEKMYDDGDDEKENKPRGGNDNDMLQK